MKLFKLLCLLGLILGWLLLSWGIMGGRGDNALSLFVFGLVVFGLLWVVK